MLTDPHFLLGRFATGLLISRQIVLVRNIGPLSAVSLSMQVLILLPAAFPHVDRAFTRSLQSALSRLLTGVVYTNATALPKIRTDTISKRRCYMLFRSFHYFWSLESNPTSYGWSCDGKKVNSYGTIILPL